MILGEWLWAISCEHLVCSTPLLQPLLFCVGRWKHFIFSLFCCQKMAKIIRVEKFSESQKKLGHFPLKSWLDKWVFLRLTYEINKIIVRFFSFTYQMLIFYSNLHKKVIGYVLIVSVGVSYSLGCDCLVLWWKVYFSQGYCEGESDCRQFWVRKNGVRILWGLLVS